METGFYTCTLLPEVTRDDPPRLGVRCSETGVLAAFWRKEDRALFLAAPDLLEALDAMLVATSSEDKDQFPGQSKAYLEIVAKPRAVAALTKARGNAANLGEK